MSAKVYMFYNGEELPPSDHFDRWNNFNNPDAVKLAILSSAIWEQKGWEVQRVTTTPHFGFSFSGRLVEPSQRYPLSRWNLWHRLRSLAPCWFTTTDIINNDFLPDPYEYDFQGKPVTIAKGFTSACMFVTPEYCEQAIAIIEAYDQGKFPEIVCDLVSDETILRYYGPSIRRADLMSHALAEIDWKSKPLWHVPRSVLQHYGKLYPPV